MSGTPLSTSLAQRFIFGVNTHVTNNVSFANNDTIAYVAGQTIVLWSLTDKRQRFLYSSEMRETITAYTYAGRRLLAVAMRGDKPEVHVYDHKNFRRKKKMILSEARDIVALSFSSDEQFLMTLTDGPDWILNVWNWAKDKSIASMAVSPTNSVINNILFSPIDNTIVTTVGQDYVKFFRTSEKEMRILTEHYVKDENFMSYCWMRHPEDHLLVGSSLGNIYLYRQGQFGMSLPAAPGPMNKNDPDINRSVTSLTSCPGGFLAGSNNSVYFYSYDDTRSDQALYDDQFKLLRVLETELCNGFLINLALSPTEELICALTSDGQLLQFPITTPSALTNDSITYAVTPFHGPKTIIDMDTCTLKPLFLTISKDQTLRLWNYETHTPDLTKEFAEDMYSVALHPNGMHCAVAFTDKLRLYHILVDDLRLCTELPIKACKEVKFSSGGSWLAAANGNAIAVYDFHRGERMADLRGHNSKVRGLDWLESGNLLSCGQDGAVYVWDIEVGRRLGEFVHKGVVFSAVTHAPENNESIFVVGNDNSIRELSLLELQPTKAQTSDVRMGHAALCSSKNILLTASTEDKDNRNRPGFIRTYNYPISGDKEDYACGSTFVTAMRLTPDQGFLITTDDLGCISVYELRDRKDRFQRQDPTGVLNLTTLESWNSEILLPLNELEEKTTQTHELLAKVEELKLHNEYQLKLKEMNYSEKLKESTDKYMQELENQKTRLELLKEECADLGLEHEEKMKNLVDKHQFNVQEMETSFQAEIMDCVNAYQALTRDRDAQLERLEIQRQQLITGHEKYVEELTRDYELKLDADRNSRLRAEDDKIELDREMKEISKQVEDDVDMEVVRLRRFYEDKLLTSREATLKYKGDNGMMRKKYSVLQRELEDMREETRQLLDKDKELNASIKMLEKEVSAHKKEIKAKDISTGEKEKKIYELKKKNQELDKFKFVLDYKIRELKQQIEPRQLEINNMREKIKDMDEELAKYHKSNANLDELIGQVRTRINDLLDETKIKSGKAKQQENRITSFRSELSIAIQHVLDPIQLKKSMEILVREYGAMGPIKPRMDPDVEGEYTRHRDFLQKSIAQLKKYLEDGSYENMQQNQSLMKNNMDLIAKINSQRDVNKKLKMEVQADIGRIRQLAQQKEIRRQKLAATQSKTANLEAQLIGEMQNVIPARQDELDPTLILERNRRRIMALRAAIAELESRRTTTKMPTGLLPPMDPALGQDQRIAFYTQAQDASELQSPRALAENGNQEEKVATAET